MRVMNKEKKIIKEYNWAADKFIEITIKGEGDF